MAPAALPMKLVRGIGEAEVIPAAHGELLDVKTTTVYMARLQMLGHLGDIPGKASAANPTVARYRVTLDFKLLSMSIAPEIAFTENQESIPNGGTLSGRCLLDQIESWLRLAYLGSSRISDSLRCGD